MKPAKTNHPTVVLVHGLWLNAMALVSLQGHVQKCGFLVHRYEYPTVRLGLIENAARLARFMDGLDADRVYVVAHSLGGLVTMRALADHLVHKVKRVVLLGSPVKGSFSGRRLASFSAGRAMLGASVRAWEQRAVAPIRDGVEVGVLAGTLPVGLGQLIGRLPKPHDGTVSVAETKLDGAADSISMPVTHTQMLFSARVASQVCSFLHHGRFNREQ